MFSLSVVAILLSCVVAYSSSNEERNPLVPGEVEKSPNAKLKCWTDALPEGGVKLWLQREGEDKILLWSSMRSVGVNWSPNSRWLAVLDNYMAGESAVLIFDCDQRTNPLVYQTPFSRSEQDSWSVVSWNVAKKEVALLRNRRFAAGEPLKTTVALTSKPVKATLYTN